ncbi:TPA: hypothetical protein OTY55_000305 [Pseudomonas aeruginosa]|nr:hypothetical protein [Pseudomonas aeruginosa]
MSIDWSKAPEGATHWEPRSDKYREAWMKNAADKWFFWGSRREAWIEESGISAEREATFEPRPQEPWNGQGLPPVGIQIEAKFPVTDVTGTHYHWRRVIVAVAGIPRAERECLVYDAENTKPAWVDEFRPLRIPEQIAAEERAKAIKEMCFAEETLTVKQAKALFDAGYRRQEEGK